MIIMQNGGGGDYIFKGCFSLRQFRTQHGIFSDWQPLNT